MTRREVREHSWLLQGDMTDMGRVQNYRYWIIWRCPTVRFLDYQKVKDVEREKATELLGTAQEPSALASKVRLVFRPPPFLPPAELTVLP